MSSRSIKDAHPLLQEQYAKAKEQFEKQYTTTEVFLTATYRSQDEQDQLFEQGRTSPGSKVTKAKGGQSPHNYLPSYAIDVAFKINGLVTWDGKWYKLFSTKMIHPQIVWGGTWKEPDMPHYELKDWKQMLLN